MALLTFGALTGACGGSSSNGDIDARSSRSDGRIDEGSSPPPAGGYFVELKPVGSWSSLPDGDACAAQVHYSTWEPRPENDLANHTMPAPGAMASSFAARPRNQGGTYDARWDSWLLPRVDGQFTGTTDEIFQWAACKWGLPDNLLRGMAVRESTWFEYLHFASGAAYWDRGTGDAFASATPDSMTYCNGIATQGLLSSQVHDYQSDPVTSVGAYPYTPAAGLCPKTFSIVGVMSWDDPAWQSPYPAYPGNQNGTFPFTRDSTAAALDYLGSYLRGCYEGWEPWLGGAYAAGDMPGCVGLWYAGDWHSVDGDDYTSRAQAEIDALTWLTPDFDDSAQHYQCDSTYGCPH